MKARRVFEKFSEESDPIRDMNIGYGEKMVKTKAFKLLQFIAKYREEGASFTDIQKYIFVTLNGHSKADFYKKEPKYDWSNGYQRQIGEQRQQRGYWTDQLYGTYRQAGLLPKYCVKNPITKKWVLKRMPKPGENLFGR